MKKSSLTSASNVFNDRNKKPELKSKYRNKKFKFLIPTIVIILIFSISYFIFFKVEEYYFDQVVLSSDGVLLLKTNMQPVNGFVLSSDFKVSKGEYKNGLPHGQHILNGSDYDTEIQYKYGEKNGLETSHYNNGQLRSRFQYVEGKRVDGLYEMWSDQGKLIRKGEIINGKLEGKYEAWNDDGILLFTGNYANGKRNGTITSYHENGLMKEKSNYKNGVKDGKSIGWSEEYVKIYNLTYDNGNLNGVCKVWSKSGVSRFNKDINVYKDDNLIVVRDNNIDTFTLILAKDNIGNTQMYHSTAVASARDCEFYGYTDWRLPTDYELEYFLPLTYWSPSNIKYDYNYWGSEKEKKSWGSTWYSYVGRGSVSGGLSQAYVRPVR